MIAATNFFDMLGMLSTDKQGKGLVNKPSYTPNNDFKSFIDRAKKDVRQDKQIEGSNESKPYKTEKNREEVKVNRDENVDKAQSAGPDKLEKNNKVDKSDYKKNAQNELSTEDEKMVEDIAQELDIDVNNLVNLLQILNIDIRSLNDTSLDSKQIAIKISDFIQSITNNVELVDNIDLKNVSMNERTEELINLLQKTLQPTANNIEATDVSKDAVSKKVDVNNTVQNQEQFNMKEAVAIQANQLAGQNNVDKNDDKRQDNKKLTDENVIGETQKAEVKQHPVVKAVEKEVQQPLQVNKQVVETKVENKSEAKSENNTEMSNLINKIKHVEFKQDNKISVDTINTNTLTVQQHETLLDKVETLKNALKTTNTQKTDVFDQVLENAKLILSDKQTEMELHLKPESLGKLSLKIATENGMVMAKITTESQQVKQIIESNMIQLKEALNQHGLNIQQFSVSVGDNSKKELFNNQRFGSSKQSKVNNLGVNTVNASESYISRILARNPYLVSESSIDFSA